MPKKVYVILEEFYEEMCGGDAYVNTYATQELAKKEFKQKVESLLRGNSDAKNYADFKSIEEISDYCGIVYERNDLSISVWENGNYNNNHHTIVFKEQELKGYEEKTELFITIDPDYDDVREHYYCKDASVLEKYWKDAVKQSFDDNELGVSPYEIFEENLTRDGIEFNHFNDIVISRD